MNTDKQYSEEKLNALSERVIGAAFKVSNTLGVGFLEKVYENALLHELRKGGLCLKLDPKPLQLLELLLRRAGELVTRKELRETLWPDSFVEFDRSINTAVNKLRKVLGDQPDSPRYIVDTLPPGIPFYRAGRRCGRCNTAQAPACARQGKPSRSADPDQFQQSVFIPVSAVRGHCESQR